jgi:hypothetical protein
MSKKKKNNNIDYEKAYREASTALRSIDKKAFRSVSKGMQFDWFNNTSFNNVVYPKFRIPPQILRMVEQRNGIVGAITTLRIQQAVEYSQISHDKDIPGWEFALRDEKKSMTPLQEKQKKFLENFFENTKVQNYNGLEPKNDSFKEVITKFIRDRLLIDKVCWEVERDRKGQAVALWVLDGATIMPVLPGGYFGATNQIGMITGYTKLADEIRKAKIESLPPLEEIAYVQELFYGFSGGGITAAFTENDIIYDIANELNDIQYYKQGFSVVEKANIAIIAFINSITYNSNGLSRGSIPKIALAMGKDSMYTQEQMEDMQDEWLANFMAMDGQWNIPLLNGDAKVLNLMPNNRDMEYQKYMEFCGSLICSIMGADPAEAGLRLNQAQNVLSENQDAKQMFSKNRGLRELLGGFAYLANKFKKMSGYDFADDFNFRFNGLSTEDKGFESDLRKKAVETDTTINELRRQRGEKPDPYGDIICNPQYIQYRIQKEQSEQMGGGEQEEQNQDEFDGDIDEIMAGMEKAIRLI